MSVEEKEYNRIHARAGVVIEHAICMTKKYRVMFDVFRNKLKRYNGIPDIVMGLVNLMVMATG